jgi:hypothetical protein
MRKNKFFTISGVACAAHTPETQKIWDSWSHNKSDYGRIAIMEYAKDLGFKYDGEEDTLNEVKEAFHFLLNEVGSNISGVKSFVLREAIIKYS